MAVAEFWERVGPQVEASFSDEQRAALDGALVQPSQSNVTGDIRISLGWFFIVLMWGPERRAPVRLKSERERRPVLSWANLPMLAAMSVGYVLASYGIVAGALSLTYNLFG